MDGITTSPAAAGTQAQQPQQPKKQAATALSSDFETFLKMLTAQAKYQDPLEPLDLAEYASQLAQFSSVEQSVRTNELLEQLVGQSGSGNWSSLASWIGKDVLTETAVRFDGAPVPLVFPTHDTATSAELVVHNAAGDEVQRFIIDPSLSEATWDGTGPTGAQLPPGDYTLKLEHYSGENLLKTHPVQSYGSVTEVHLVDGSPVLHLAGGGQVDLGEVKAIR